LSMPRRSLKSSWGIWQLMIRVDLWFCFDFFKF
jgi:hypothetical protein